MINALGWALWGSIIIAILLKTFWRLTDQQFIALMMSVGLFLLAIFLITFGR